VYSNLCCNYHTTTGACMPYGITQSYLPPSRGSTSTLTPAGWKAKQTWADTSLCVCVCVCMCVGHTGEPYKNGQSKMPFGLQTPVGPRNHVLHLIEYIWTSLGEYDWITLMTCAQWRYDERMIPQIYVHLNDYGTL